jgi:AraC-like DNA-binding protein/ligand-binding sensor protein
MPRIIRRALYQKLREMPELVAFQRDFERLSGLRLDFVDELGMCGDGIPAGSGLCAAMAADPAGRAMCARLRHGLFAATVNHQPACAVCDAGLVEVVVPMRISGITAGFFLFHGVAEQQPDLPARHKTRHLLRKAGVGIGDAELDALMDAVPVRDSGVLDALRRIAHLAARQLALKITDRLADPEARMPVAVAKACGFIRAHALCEEIPLTRVARHCGMSDGHLSRMFHHATGLTFREYVTQVRLEHARGLLLRSGRSITEISGESGFQSLSQFHRVFRKAFGMSPGCLRRSGRTDGTGLPPKRPRARKKSLLSPDDSTSFGARVTGRSSAW